MLVYALFEYSFWGKEYARFWCIKLKGILTGMALIPTLYYTYTGIIGESLDWFNIVILFWSGRIGVFSRDKNVSWKQDVQNSFEICLCNALYYRHCVLCIYLLSARDSVLFRILSAKHMVFNFVMIFAFSP